MADILAKGNGIAKFWITKEISVDCFRLYAPRAIERDRPGEALQVKLVRPAELFLKLSKLLIVSEFWPIPKRIKYVRQSRGAN